MTCLPRRRHTLRYLLAVICSLGWLAADVAAESSSPAPLFGRHVVAVLDRLGCNSGACHGSFRGQNGFRLALFAGDPAMDYEYIVRDAFGRRIDRADPDKS